MGFNIDGVVVTDAFVDGLVLCEGLKGRTHGDEATRVGPNEQFELRDRQIAWHGN